MKINVVILSVVLTVSNVFGQAQTLENLQSIYNTNKDKLDTAYIAAISQINMQYDSYLDQQLLTLKNQGKWDDYNKIKQEKDRFSADKVLPEQFQPKVIEAKINGAMKEVVLIDGYISALKKLQADYMKIDQMVKAGEVNNEIKKMELVKANLDKNRPKTAEEKLKEGLVLHYSFDKNEGNKVTDLSGNGNHGVVHGATWKALVDGRKGVMWLDGKDIIDSQKNILGESNWSISFWVMMPKVAEAEGMTVFKQWGSVRNGGTVIEIRDKAVFWMHVGADGQKKGAAIGTQQDMQWGHFILVRSADNICSYLNGILVQKIMMPLTKTSGDTANIGGFNGFFDNLMIWNRTLDKSEVIQIHRN